MTKHVHQCPDVNDDHKKHPMLLPSPCTSIMRKEPTPAVLPITAQAAYSAASHLRGL